jgi:hypothetical protein
MLPWVQSEERRSADVLELNRAARAALGVEVSVLSCLADEPGADGRPRQQVHALEVHGSSDAPRAGRWCASHAVGELPVARSRHRDWIGAALASQRGDAPVRARREWVVAGWREGALAWAEAALAPHGVGGVVEVEQVRLWEFSNLLRLQTAAGGTFYLKAVAEAGRHEVPFTARLATEAPATMPDVVAVDTSRHWLLLRATAGPQLTEVTALASWVDAAAAIARIQVAWVGRGAELRALGCPAFGLSWLAARIAPLLADTAALRPAHAEPLTRDEVDSLRALEPALQALCAELAAHGVPDSIEHGDLWGDNVIVSDRGPVLIDWEDASLSHPFLSPAILSLHARLIGPPLDGPDTARAIRDAYLAPWRDGGPLAAWPAARVEAAFDLAQRVAPLYYAAQFREGLSRIETSWEVRSFTPFFLRRLLETD